jgi:hypothetical protein
MDVGIVKEHNDLVKLIRGTHLLYHRPRARGTAGVEENFFDIGWWVAG